MAIKVFVIYTEREVWSKSVKWETRGFSQLTVEFGFGAGACKSTLDEEDTMQCIFECKITHLIQWKKQCNFIPIPNY